MKTIRPYRARLFAAGFAIATLLAVAAALWLDRRNEVNHAETLTKAMAHAVAEQIEGSLRSIEGLLSEVVGAEQAGKWSDPAQRDRLLARKAAYPELLYLAIIDANGIMRKETVPPLRMADGGENVAERDYVRRHYDSVNDAPLIGLPIIGRLTRERTITLSRAIRNPDGSLRAIAMAAIASDYYAAILDTNMLDRDGATALLSLTGDIMARAPNQAEKFADNIATSDLFRVFLPRTDRGIATLTAKADGHVKILAYQSLQRYPLLVTSGLSMPIALKSWYWRSSAVLTTTLVLLIVIFYTAWQVDQRHGSLLEQQAGLEQQIQQRTALLTLAQSNAETRSQRLETLNGKLTRLALIAAHHLQEPLRPIVSFAQLAKRHLSSDPQTAQASLEYVEKAGMRLKSVLQAFQRYTEMLCHQPVQHVVCLDRIVDHALSRLQKDVERQNVTIVRHPLPDVLGDAAMLDCAIYELLSNAITYVHPDRVPRIEISGELDDFHWSIRISDNGPGIPPALSEHIFQAFSRPHEDKPDAIGLGLAMALTIAEAHDGTIQLSTSAQGSCVTIWVPLKLAADSPPPPPL